MFNTSPFFAAQAPVAIVGGGLAGCECALALARAGIACVLYEQKPAVFSPAHVSPNLGELVCSNSFRSNDAVTSGVGLLKQEMREIGSETMVAASATAVPAGKALAVDRELFSACLTRRVEETPLILLKRRMIADLDDPELAGKMVVVAAGPLASDSLAKSLAHSSSLYFYDAIAPVVSADSVDNTRAFRGSRYGDDSGSGDYLNCPMDRQEYEVFWQALLSADKMPAHAFEKEIHFEGCMPLEVLAERGQRTLAFGPLKPVGFSDPRTGKRPWALLQLRAENTNRSAYNLVGCQTKMTQAAQARVFRLVPGLERAEFLRFGSMHRNTYVDAPLCLAPDLGLKARPDIYLAGQITGVEGYVESAACGLWAGILLAAHLHGRTVPLPPPTTALGALLGHLRTPVRHFQPSNVHFGLMPALSDAEHLHKKERKAALYARARTEFLAWRQCL